MLPATCVLYMTSLNRRYEAEFLNFLVSISLQRFPEKGPLGQRRPTLSYRLMPFECLAGGPRMSKRLTRFLLRRKQMTAGMNTLTLVKQPSLRVYSFVKSKNCLYVCRKRASFARFILVKCPQKLLNIRNFMMFIFAFLK